MSATSALSQWLAGTPASAFVRTELWVVPAVQSIHILAISVVMASVAILNLRLAGFLGREQSVRDISRRFHPWMAGALIVLFLTGLVMIVGEPDRELLNILFWSKMGLILAAVALTWPPRVMLEDSPYRDMPAAKRRIVRLCALVSLLLWLGVLTCGRLIAYFGGAV